MANDYYVYAHYYEDGVPFYVGSGRGRRISISVDECYRENRRKDLTIRRIKEAGGIIISKKLYENLTWMDARRIEGDLTDEIGIVPNGSLVNHKRGGAGPSGHSQTTTNNLKAKWAERKQLMESGRRLVEASGLTARRLLEIFETDPQFVIKLWMRIAHPDREDGSIKVKEVVDATGA